MDKLKGMASDKAGNLGDMAGIGDTLNGINFPISKDQLVQQLKSHGVPSQVTDKLSKTDVSQFNSKDDVMAQVKNLV